MKKILLAAVMMLLLGTGCSVTSTDGQAAATAATATRPASTTRVVAEGALTAAAKVVPVRSAVLSLPSGGTIAEVLVAEGDRVQAGQPLVRLDRARATANVAQAEAQLAQAQATYEKLRAGATPEEIAMAEAQLRAAQAQLRQTTGGVTPADQTAAAAQLQQARSHLAELQSGPQRADVRGAEAQLAQTQANLTTQRAQLSAAKTNAQLQMEQAANALRDRQADYSRIYWDNRAQEDRLARFGQELPQANKDQEAAALRAVQSAEETLKQAQVAYDTARQAEVSGIQAAEQQAVSSQANLDKLRAGANADELAAARAQVASSQASLDKLRGEQRSGALDAAQAAVDQAQASLARLRAGASQSDLAVAAAEVQSAQAGLKLAQVAVAEAELRAPFAGTIATLDLKVGEYGAPGAPVMHLADLSTWQIETTDLTEQNIVRVKEGSQATVTFDAIPGLELPGKVSRIRALGENKQGDITYAVTITLDRQDPRLHWNMTAAAAIGQQ